MINFLLIMGVLILGIPCGIFLEKTCKDEIKVWRKRILGLTITSLIFSIGILFTNFQFKIPISLTLIFMILVFLTMILRSDKRI